MGCRRGLCGVGGMAEVFSAEVVEGIMLMSFKVEEVGSDVTKV
jgi:hypothetical protein